MARVRTACLISGRGSNMAALIDAAQAPGFPAEIALVLSNKADAGGLETASRAGIATGVISHRDYPDRAAFDAALDAALRAAGVELICLAGFMRLLTAEFVTAWSGRMINIHPSLLPAFKGLHVHERALEAQVRLTGCTVHFVTPGMDEGPPIVQAAVPVLPGDDAASLAARVLKAEHRAYPLGLRLVAEGRARLVDDRVALDAAIDAAATLLSPGG
ncbi:phosphoribosylglycinamide formyltransferase [Zavarzinia sp. CC-PAN008]|uniref:phosphoribosylglycinamide formyltransferase n=1 Tax=Zavarzinia sp. CC-PAN008 TaxID=3243332 RepID=UPI003F74542B